MTEQLMEPRIIPSQDWATAIFVLAVVLIAITRTVFEKRFADFVRLGISDKYVKVYRDPSHITGGFTILLFFVQLISLSLFILLALDKFGYAQKTDWLLFTMIISLLGTFILAKFLIDKIIAASFNIDEIAEQFNLSKVSYRTYIGLALLPVNGILFYNDLPEIAYFIIISALLTTNLLTYLLALRNYQSIVVEKLFYFILYLCALEIGPYYFMYYWFTRN